MQTEKTTPYLHPYLLCFTNLLFNRNPYSTVFSTCWQLKMNKTNKLLQSTTHVIQINKSETRTHYRSYCWVIDKFTIFILRVCWWFIKSSVVQKELVLLKIDTRSHYHTHTLAHTRTGRHAGVCPRIWLLLL
jgi:hypothetical protein